jgi:hypothetical protein
LHATARSGVERELLVLELGSERLELDGVLADARGRRLDDPGTNDPCERAPPLHRRGRRCAVADLVDDERVALALEQLEERPSPPARADAQAADGDAADEDRHRQRGSDLCRGERERDRERPERQGPPLVLAQVVQVGRGDLDRARVHHPVTSEPEPDLHRRRHEPAGDVPELDRPHRALALDDGEMMDVVLGHQDPRRLE